MVKHQNRLHGKYVHWDLCYITRAAGNWYFQRIENFPTGPVTLQSEQKLTSSCRLPPNSTNFNVACMSKLHKPDDSLVTWAPKGFVELSPRKACCIILVHQLMRHVDMYFITKSDLFTFPAVKIKQKQKIEMPNNFDFHLLWKW